MSIEPIRPEDHSIGTDPTVDNGMPWTDEFNDWRMFALAEAIHQTFERDAEGIAAMNERYPEQAAKKGQPPAHRLRQEWPDPDTEIDRLARLIVQGEYRRRAEQQTDQSAFASAESFAGAKFPTTRKEAPNER